MDARPEQPVKIITELALGVQFFKTSAWRLKPRPELLIRTELLTYLY